jgi:AraC-like DNA-binding protein
MISVQFVVPEKLNSLIKSFWHLEVAHEETAIYQEEIVPDGHHEIIFHINSEPGRIKMANTGWLDEPHALIAGQTLQKHHLKLSPGSRLYGIRFYPHTLAGFLNLPISDLTDRINALESITNARPFWNCIMDNPSQTFLNFERLLVEKLQIDTIRSAGYSYIDAAVASILRARGQVTGEQLLNRTGISKMHLDKLFLKYVGITPKIFSRIIQLNHFIEHKAKYPASSLTDCCYATGYYDQSHLIKAFHSFTGQSPRAYFNSRNEISEIFSAF